MTERTHFTPSDCLTPADLAHLHARQAALAGLFRTALHRLTRLETPDLQRGVYTPAFPALLNILEDNFRALAHGYEARDIEPARTWLGAERDKPKLDYTDANRWFASAERLTQGIHMTRARLPMTNACTAGGDRTKQFIRTVRQ